MFDVTQVRVKANLDQLNKPSHKEFLRKLAKLRGPSDPANSIWLFGPKPGSDPTQQITVTLLKEHMPINNEFTPTLVEISTEADVSVPVEVEAPNESSIIIEAVAGEKVWALRTVNDVLHSPSFDEKKSAATARLLNQTLVEFSISGEKTPLDLWLNHDQVL